MLIIGNHHSVGNCSLYSYTAGPHVGRQGLSMRSSIARATAIEYGVIAAGIFVSCVVRYFHYGLGASAAEYGIIAVGAAVMLILGVEGFASRLHRPL